MADTDVFGESSAEKMSTEDLPEATTAEDITEEEASKEVKEELLKEETKELKPDTSVQEIVDENGDVYEETTQVARKVVKRTMKITETSSTTKTTTMTTPAKLYGKDLSEYDEVDVDALLAQLSPEEINILAKEVDPDDNFLPPNQRCSYECKKDPTGPLDRKKLIEHINKEALETPDLPELEPFVKGTIRGKKWVPPPRDDREIAAEEQIAIDMGEEYEHALSDATQEEIIDLAAILGFHSMMNQDQYHASLLNKGQPIGMGWDGITKSTAQKLYPMDPPNTTDIDESVKRVKDDDPKLIELNLNNIKNISDEKYEQLFAALPQNEHLEVLSLTNVGLTDKTALLLAEAIEKSKTLRVLNVETNFISPPVIVTLVKALLKARTIEEFRASNQRSTVLGNKIEMEITDLVEKNTSLLRLGLHLEFNDARHRVAAHLQRNIDRSEHELRKGNSLSPIPKSTSPINRGNDLLSMQKAKSPKPIHLVLTPQERIDSKSELKASLASQKQNGGDRGEISLAIPHNHATISSAMKESNAPIKEKITSVKTLESQLKSKEKKAGIENLDDFKEVSPKHNVRVKTPPQEIQDRESNIKNINEFEEISPKLSICEKSPPKDIKPPMSPIEVKPPVRENISPIKDNSSVRKTISPIKAKSLIRETVSPLSYLGEEINPVEGKSQIKEEKHKVIAYKVPPTPCPSLEEDIPSVERKISPTRNPKIGELRHSNLSRAIDNDSLDLKGYLFKETESIETIKPEASTEQPEILSELLENPPEKEKSKLPEETKSLFPIHDRDRDRLSESVSPSRHLEDKMSQLQAKINSFAEVADEKMASLRLKIDDIARNPLNQISNDVVKPREIPKQYVNVMESLDKLSKSDEVVPINLPPKRPSKNVLEPSFPLEKTPNSVGITLLYQQPIYEKCSINKITEGAISPQVDEIKQKVENVNDVPEATIVEERIMEKISDELVKAVVDEIPKDQSVQTLSPPKNPVDISSSNNFPLNVEIRDTDESMLKSLSFPSKNIVTELETPLLYSQKELDVDNRTNPFNVKNYKPDESTIKIEKPLEQTVEPQTGIQDPEVPKVDKKALALSLLTFKKTETLNIDPIKTKEAETQSLPKRFPLLGLSIKEGESQKIDPVKVTEAATQSIPQCNPLSLLSIKKGEIMTIDPVKKSEVSTQFLFEKPQMESSAQTIAEDPIKTLEDATQTPLVYSSLEHDFIFPGLRRVPYLPRPKSINIGGSDRVVVKPSSKPINEVLMLLYPVLHDYNKSKESKTFGLEEDIIKTNEADNTIRDLENTMRKATEASETILKAPSKPPEEPEKAKEPANTSVRTEIEIPLGKDSQPSFASESRFETKFTAVEKVSAISRTTIESEEHVKVIDEAYKSVAEVSTSDKEKSSMTTSIKSANMWQSLSSNLIKASEQTLLDLSKAAEMGDKPLSKRTKIGKIGKVSVYSSIEDLSRSKISDRHLGTLIKTVETTSVYSSLEDIPYTKYSDRYKDGKTIVSTASAYSSTEDLPQKSRSKYNLDLTRPIAKSSVYSSTEDLYVASSSKYSNRYSDFKPLHYKIDLPNPTEKPREKLSLLPRSKFADRYKDDYLKTIDMHSSAMTTVPRELSPVSSIIDKSFYKSAICGDNSGHRSQYKSSEELLQRTKITSDRSKHESNKSEDSSHRNQSTMRPYTYVPTMVAHTDLSFDHVRPRPISPSTHTTTLQLNISPSGISELPSTSRSPRYPSRENVDKPIIKISRVRDDVRYFKAVSPIEKRLRDSKNLLSPYHLVSDSIDANDEQSTTIDESTQPTLYTSSSSTADNETTMAPKKRLNIMDTIKMLKNRVRDVITTEDRLTESHRLPSSSSNTSSSSFTRRGSRSSGVKSKIPYDNTEKDF